MLIDHDRYSRLEEEAARTGQSVAAVIRLAIDRLLTTAPSVREAAAFSLLAGGRDAVEPGVEWSAVKQSMEGGLAAKVR